MKRILVTGAAGFIGYNLCLDLLKRGDQIIGVDNINDYYDINLKLSRLKILQEFENFIFIKADVSDFLAMNILFKDHKIDRVCHLAAQAGVRYSIENPLVYEKSNGLGTLVILECCRHFNVKYFVYASSSSVYGGIKEVPFNESQDVSSPISLYAATKKYNELQASVYHKLYGIHVTGLRFFTVYGPYGRPDMAVFIFTKNIVEGKKIDVYNNGEMSRDFTYVSDIVQGIVSSIDKCEGCEVFNLCRGESIKLMDFISAIEVATGKKAIINYMPMQSGDVKITNGDNSKARNLLGYCPKVSVNKGVNEFVKWYKWYYSIEE